MYMKLDRVVRKLLAQACARLMQLRMHAPAFAHRLARTRTRARTHAPSSSHNFVILRRSSILPSTSSTRAPRAEAAIVHVSFFQSTGPVCRPQLACFVVAKLNRRGRAEVYDEHNCYICIRIDLLLIERLQLTITAHSVRRFNLVRTIDEAAMRLRCSARCVQPQMAGCPPLLETRASPPHVHTLVAAVTHNSTILHSPIQHRRFDPRSPCPAAANWRVSVRTVTQRVLFCRDRFATPS
eukprot:6188332-Pleurochrysis_carterae.AAC.1